MVETAVKLQPAKLTPNIQYFSSTDSRQRSTRIRLQASGTRGHKLMLDDIEKFSNFLPIHFGKRWMYNAYKPWQIRSVISQFPTGLEE